jgi:hypothetical protein
MGSIRNTAPRRRRHRRAERFDSRRTTTNCAVRTGRNEHREELVKLDASSVSPQPTDAAPLRCSLSGGLCRSWRKLRELNSVAT